MSTRWWTPSGDLFLAAALSTLGWVDEHPYTSPTVLPMHSLTFRHTQWPCGAPLDLHDRFPGLFADRQSLRDTLVPAWNSHRGRSSDSPCPDPASQALILALHSLRDPHEPAKAADLDDLVVRISTGMEDTGLPGPRRVGMRPRGSRQRQAVPRSPRRPSPWCRLDHEGRHAGLAAPSAADTTAVSWVEGDRRRPIGSWPRYLWYAAWLSERELRFRQPRFATGSSPSNACEGTSTQAGPCSRSRGRLGHCPPYATSQMTRPRC